MARRRRQRGRHANYDDAIKAAALADLLANGGDLAKTARSLGIKPSTLAAWSQGRNVDKAVYVSHVKTKIKPMMARVEGLQWMWDALKSGGAGQV